VLGVSLWILLDKTYVGELFGTDLIRIAGIILVCGACVLLCVSLVGTVASAKENKKLLFGVSRIKIKQHIPVQYTSS